MSEKKLLGLIGSYRKTGNSEIVVKTVAERCAGWDLRLVSLPRLSILPCKGCYACLLPGVTCAIRDDMQWLLERMREADAIIVAAPNYVLGPVGIMKMIADRALQAFPYFKEFRAKRTAVALTLGREEYRGYADTALSSQVTALGLNISAPELFYSTHPGETALADDFEEKTERLARHIRGDDPEVRPAPDRCPRCHSDLFRIKDHEFECAICKSRAAIEGGSLHFHYFDPEFGEEGLREHMNWLMMKKSEYAGLKERLSAIQARYKGGRWITPADGAHETPTGS